MSEPESIEERLAKEGWSKRFVANEPRLSEAVQLYEESGFEVRLEPLPKKPTCESCPGPEEEQAGQGECRICFEGFEAQFKIIFTRPRPGADTEGDLI